MTDNRQTSKSVELYFEVDRPTKQKVRFVELAPRGPDDYGPDRRAAEKQAAVLYVYVVKTLLAKWGDPQRLRVTVEAIK